ncbi:hypothetical protein GHT06_015035 [Daphnia sinensis]|uniref:Phospholipid/glycerol acyltransferase domain-containing protein n=1 Tax=Daphnia sinensis TaxID=1820382 RepID=A0AAD5KQP0_9CRUS|nr:hypothetical protein GHT06_015035 [Daphnia sinensis]
MKGFLAKIRYVFAVIVITGSAPNYFLLWALWRGISLFMPQWKYQDGDDFLYSMYQRMVIFFFEHCTGQKVYFTGDAATIFSKKENVLYLGNHQSTVDWIVCNMVAIRQGSIGHLRYVMKDTLQALPLYGHYFYQHGCIYVKRGDFKQKKMESALDYLKDPKIKSWTVIFPEGTCFAPNEYDLIKKSNKAADDNGLKPLLNHLTPRYRGSFLALAKLRSNLDAIYDVTCVYSGSVNDKKERIPAPELIDFLLGKNSEMYIHVRRIPIEDVPEDEAQFKSWMHNLFTVKDELVSRFYQDGYFQKDVQLKTAENHYALPYTATVPSFLFFVLSFLPLVLFPGLRLLWLQAILLSTVCGYLVLAIKSVC